MSQSEPFLLPVVSITRSWHAAVNTAVQAVLETMAKEWIAAAAAATRHAKSCRTQQAAGTGASLLGPQPIKVITLTVVVTVTV